MAPLDAAEDTKDKEEETPEIKELKVLDDKFLELQKECDREVQAVQRRFQELQRPVLQQRADVLVRGGSDANTGTPAVSGFWVQAMQNHSAFQEEIEEWDSPVLEYVQDIVLENLDPEDLNKGFRLTFKFADNPFFENKTLWKEYHTEEDSPYTGDINCIECKASKIEWKAGKDVTMEIVKKKSKGAKKKQAKEKKEPRNSFLRNFFTDLKQNEPVPDDFDRERIRELCDDSEEEEDDERVMDNLMDVDYEMGCALRDNIVPFAVRWYTEEGEEDEEEEDSDEEEEEDHRRSARRGRAKASAARGAAKAAPKAVDAPAGGSAAGGAAKEECKQQ